ncbi:plexin-C1-like [Pholidichthys leucotaenia]
MLLLLGLLSVLCGEPGLSLQDGGEFTFDGRIRQFAVSDSSVYVATEERLYHLNHDLSLASSLTQRGFLNNLEFYRVSEKAAGNATFHVNVLLPFGKNNSLIVCGVISECYCEVLDPKNISKLVYKEPVQVGPQKHSQGSLSLLVDVRTRSQTDTYILTAVENKTKSEIQCSLDYGTVNLQNTNKDQAGDIFSVNEGSSSTVIKTQDGVDFVDGFQINSTIYLLSNVLSENKNKIRLIWLKAETSKSATLKSLRGATLTPSDGGDGGSRLVASSLIPGGQQVLWSGVFIPDGDRNNTELLVFDISPDLSRPTDDDPHFSTTDKFSLKTPKTLKPKAVISKQNNMTAVLAVKKRGWMVFFIGTGDGQLFKLAIDRNYHPACSTVLHIANDDRQVFPKLHLDPVDQKHMYLPFRNQMIRVPVSNCSTHTTLHECWSAQDPFCVWCGSKKSCTFEDDCKGSDWLSIPDEFQQKMVSHKVELDKNGQITLSIQIHMTWGTGVPSNFACQFSTTSGELCSHINTPAFPQCSCIISNEPLPANGLKVSVKYRLEEIFLDERLMLTNCSEISGSPSSALCRRCIEAGCGWSKDGCSWANQGETNISVCQNMDVGMNFSKPDITSITPSVVSFYGRNNAVLAGFNLRNVTKVRIQADVDCSPKESPVWNQTDTTLMFHIPGTDTKGTFKACAVLSDGTCHGAATITYQSLPSCTDITPKSSWYSGGRKLTLRGFHLEFVEEIIHSHTTQKVRLPRNISYQSLTYDTPAAEHTWGSSHSAVLLKVGNQTLPCPIKLNYYPDPEFTSFTSTRKGDDVLITIQKKADKLEMTTAELSVWGVQEEKQYPCIIKDNRRNIETDFLMCEIPSIPTEEIQLLVIKYGDKTVRLRFLSSVHQAILMLRLLFIPIVVVALVTICWWQKRLSAEMKTL